MEDAKEAIWKREWQEILERARARPSRWIGDPERGHIYVIQAALRLVWEARVFQRPRATRVRVCPTQYVLQSGSGPLVRPVEAMFPWEGKRVLTEGWQEPIEQLREEQDRRIFGYLPLLRGWRRVLCGPTGPMLDTPALPMFLTKQFVIAYRTRRGFRCQAFDQGWPTSEPFLLPVGSSEIGFLVAAALDPQFFTGLPFTAEALRKAVPKQAEPYVTMDRHPTDELVDASSLAPERIRLWLDGRAVEGWP